MARIFVTGGGGFIGRNTIPKLLEEHHSVVALQRQSVIIPALHSSLSVVPGDLRGDTDSLRAAVGDCDTLLHLAGETTPSCSGADLNMELQANLSPLLRLFEASKDSAVKRVVVLSSGGTVYGTPQFTPINEDHPTTPTTPYGLGKLTAEHLTRLWATQHGLEYILLRAANPYGPHQLGRNNQGVIGVWLQNVRREIPLVVWGDGTSVRDYLYVADLAQALTIACAQATLNSGIYNIGSGDGKNLLQIAKAIAEVTNIQPRLEFTPAKPYDVAVNILCTKRYHAATGWQATTGLLEGIRLTYEFLQHA